MSDAGIEELSQSGSGEKQLATPAEEAKARKSAKGKGKQKKVFLSTTSALDLADSIASSIQAKTANKVSHHLPTYVPDSEGKVKRPKRKDVKRKEIEQMKMKIAERNKKKKVERALSKKKPNKSQVDKASSAVTPSKAPAKRVMFA